jgi:hypothetical protein
VRAPLLCISSLHPKKKKKKKPIERRISRTRSGEVGHPLQASMQSQKRCERGIFSASLSYNPALVAYVHISSALFAMLIHLCICYRNQNSGYPLASVFRIA